MEEVKPQVSSIFTTKIQKLPLTLVFSYMMYYEDVMKLFYRLCKGSRVFLERNID